MNAKTIAAIYTFAAHYHSGQWSRGYRLLCAAGKAWQRKAHIPPRLDYWESLINNPREPVAYLYHKLAARYGDKI